MENNSKRTYYNKVRCMISVICYINSGGGINISRLRLELDFGT